MCKKSLVLLKDVSSSKLIHHYCLKSNKSGTFDHSRFPGLIFGNIRAYESFLVHKKQQKGFGHYCIRIQTSQSVWH